MPMAGTPARRAAAIGSGGMAGDTHTAPTLRRRKRGGDVHVEAPALDGAGVHRARLETDRRPHAAREEPRGDRRPHDDRHLRPPLGEGVDDGDLPHGVAEAVPGYVENNRHQYSPGTMRQRTWRR